MTRRAETVFLDLDGPVLDIRGRHYACYLELCARYGSAPLPLEDYWLQRRRRRGAPEVLVERGVSADPAALRDEWIGLIEQPRFLAYDTCQPEAVETLSIWNEAGIRMLLVTLRRNGPATRTQLETLDLLRFFEDVVICDPELGGLGKAAAATRRVERLDPATSAWIGDTEVDAHAAAALRCAKLYLVTCGIRNPELLRSLGGMVVRDLAEVDQYERTCCKPAALNAASTDGASEGSPE